VMMTRLAITGDPGLDLSLVEMERAGPSFTVDSVVQLRAGLEEAGLVVSGTSPDGRLVEVASRTWAEGLSTGTAFELPQRILRRLLDDFVLVSDDDIRAAVRTLLERTRTVVEGAGAAPLAAGLALKERLAGRRVVLILSGGNISAAQLRTVLGEA